MLKALSLTKRYNGQVALNNLSLTVNNGEVFCLLGHNRIGKTKTSQFWVVSLQKSSNFNTVVLLLSWIVLLIILKH